MEHEREGSKTQTPANFTPPRHWTDLRELSPAYWADAKNQEIRGQEFSHKPIETLELIEKIDTKGLARREFLTVMGASMAMASAACMRKPVHKIIPYVVRPQEIIPGLPTWYASTCQECPTGCGILTKNREGRPIKLEGNPEHPINKGALCLRGQASILSLYDPDRLKGPMSISRSGGVRKSIPWADADALVAEKLKAVAAKGGKIRVLTGKVNGEASRRLIQEFLAGFRDGTHIEFEVLGHDDLTEAQAESYGAPIVPAYDFEKAEVVVSLGADFLGEWVSPVEHAAAWARRRKLEGQSHESAKLSKFFSFESGLTITGANADEHFPVRPGDELKVALAIAYELAVNQRKSRYATDPLVQSVLKGYSPETVATDIGGSLRSEHIKSVAGALWEARGKSLVVAGGASSRTQDAVALQVAVNLLNSLLENEGATIDAASAVPSGKNGFSDFLKLSQEMNAGQVEVLVIYGPNPVYTLPESAGFSEGLKKVPFVVAVATHLDETARGSDLALAANHPLENWGDAHPRAGVYSLQQPAITPLHDTRSFQDVLIAWVHATGPSKVKNDLLGRIASAAPVAVPLPVIPPAVAPAGVVGAPAFYDYLKEYWKEAIFPKHGHDSAGFEDFWDTVLERGVLNVGKVAGSRREFKTASLKRIPAYRRADGGLKLALYSKISMGDGRGANNPWLQEMPDPIAKITWDNYINVAPVTAKKLDLTNNDVVAISGDGIAAELPVHVQPGMHEDSVSVAVGYGRTSAGNVGTGVGVNFFPFAKTDGGRHVMSGAAVQLRKTGKRYELGTTQGHDLTLDRPIINDIALATYRKNAAAANDTDPQLRYKEVPTIWPKWDYTRPYRWGMTIDLNSCTGCGACVIACQAENNIPVVGRSQVRMGREMHWIRIDRYYSGTGENPEIVFQPMLCQHCENAPCETVCPVLATMHDDEGINQMVYNRCVGTRYCQNNCPYKVRRFNFFDNWKQYKDTMNMAWNPDVTVRTRGVMEKCTFCVQRVNAAKSIAKDHGEIIKDGDLKTACQQTCPTQAIVFGNVNDAASGVSKLKREPRAFHVLETLNTVPSISYLTKVRNREAGREGKET